MATEARSHNKTVALRWYFRDVSDRARHGGRVGTALLHRTDHCRPHATEALGTVSPKRSPKYHRFITTLL